MVRSSAMRFLVLAWLTIPLLACREDPLDAIARGYVELQNEWSLPEVEVLLRDLESLEISPRGRHLQEQLAAHAALLGIAGGKDLPFDEESRLVYGVAAPAVDEAMTSRARAALDRLLPGEGPLAPRYAIFHERFLVPPEKLEAVLTRALDESRRRTLRHIDLAAEENVRLEYVSGAPWPSFARYMGSYQSVVQINRDFPLAVADVLEIATHEAYPGHHTASVLLDREVVRQGLVELGVDPVVGPDALLREGLAGYGLELAFPGEERLRFEKEVLFPLAGLDPAEAELCARVQREIRRLAPLRVEGARAYLDGKRDRVQSALWLENEALVPAPWAFLAFVDRYRTYVVAYTAGPELVRRRIESRPADPWQEYAALLTEWPQWNE
jgi:hypothetical protein